MCTTTNFPFPGASSKALIIFIAWTRVDARRVRKTQKQQEKSFFFNSLRCARSFVIGSSVLTSLVAFLLIITRLLNN